MRSRKKCSFSRSDGTSVTITAETSLLPKSPELLQVILVKISTDSPCLVWKRNCNASCSSSLRRTPFWDKILTNFILFARFYSRLRDALVSKALQKQKPKNERVIAFHGFLCLLQERERDSLVDQPDSLQDQRLDSWFWSHEKKHWFLSSNRLVNNAVCLRPEKISEKTIHGSRFFFSFEMQALNFVQTKYKDLRIWQK